MVDEEVQTSPRIDSQQDYSSVPSAEADLNQVSFPVPALHEAARIGNPIIVPPFALFISFQTLVVSVIMN